MKKIKKSVSLLVLLFAGVFLVSCAGLESATLEGDDKPFVEVLKESCSLMAKEVEDREEKIDYEVSADEGWDGSSELDEDMLGKDEKAVTYTIQIKITDDDEVERNTAKIFAVLYEDDNTLSLMGLYLNEDGRAREYGADEAEEFIEELSDY